MSRRGVASDAPTRGSAAAVGNSFAVTNAMNRREPDVAPPSGGGTSRGADDRPEGSPTA